MITRRILIAVHGHEPSDWVRGTLDALIAREPYVLRLLAVLDLPQPPCPSPLPAAHRRHRAALAEARHLELERLDRALAPLVGALPHPPAVVRVVAERADPGRTIAANAASWPADVVVVGRDVRPWPERLLLGRVHERVMRWAPCTVLVPGGAAPAGPVTSRWPRLRRLAGVEGRA